MKEKVILAYSGGLDTTAIIPWLKENFDYEVICVCVDCGQAEELDGLEERAKFCGASKLYIENVVDEFCDEYIVPCVQANAIYENKYLLGTSMARPVIAKKLVEIARKEGATAICHGATGKGNDQIRFELGIKALAPDLKIIAAWRNDKWTMDSRESEIEYCKAHGIDLPFSADSSYSRDRNIWHISHEGLELEDPANEPNFEHLLVLGTTPEKAPDEGEYVTMTFEKGVPTVSLWVVFNLYRVLGGIGVGMASAICPMYIAEVAPADKRGTLVSWNQFAIIFGQLVVYFVNFVILGDHIAPKMEVMAEGLSRIVNLDELAADGNWSVSLGWRLMFVSECVPAGLFTILILLVPETPRYLAMAGKERQALEVLERINGSSRAKKILEEIESTVVEEKEKLLTYGWLVIFIGIMLSVFQQAVGINAVLYYAPRIFESMGMGNPMMQTVMMGVINITFTLVAILTVEKIGRKPLLIVGSLGMALGALGVTLSAAIPTLPGIIGVLSIMIYSACFMFSWGPICWVLISEIFPNTIRGAAVAIAVAFQWISNFIVSSTFVPMYAWSPSFTYGLYAVICVLAAVFVWKLVPETKGKTLEQMTDLWKKSIK